MDKCKSKTIIENLQKNYKYMMNLKITSNYFKDIYTVDYQFKPLA